MTKKMVMPWEDRPRMCGRHVALFEKSGNRPLPSSLLQPDL